MSNYIQVRNVLINIIFFIKKYISQQDQQHYHQSVTMKKFANLWTKTVSFYLLLMN